MISRCYFHCLRCGAPVEDTPLCPGSCKGSRPDRPEPQPSRPRRKAARKPKTRRAYTAPACATEMTFSTALPQPPACMAIEPTPDPTRHSPRHSPKQPPIRPANEPALPALDASERAVCRGCGRTLPLPHSINGKDPNPVTECDACSEGGTPERSEAAWRICWRLALSYKGYCETVPQPKARTKNPKGATHEHVMV